MKDPKNIAITGASSGLGAALALHYAASGIILHLQGRDKDRLEKVAAACQTKGAQVYAVLLDVTDADATSRWLQDADAKTPIDLIIANAGVSAGTGIHGEGGDQARRIFSTNIGGVVNSVEPLLPAMISRRRGQIAIMSSLASFRGLPSAPAYSASKACVRAWGEALRGWLSGTGVELSVVCPGYIRTPMTDTNPFPMPFIMDADKAAGIIANGLARNKARIAFPFVLYAAIWLLGCLPPSLTDPLFSRLPAKPSI